MERLLDYDRRRYWLANGWSIRFRIWRVPETAHRPHGIRYSFTLHDIAGTRILGFDNAHAWNRRVVPHDHRHGFRELDRLLPYDFVDADRLLVDFMDAVEAACHREGVRLLIAEADTFELGDMPDADGEEE